MSQQLLQLTLLNPARGKLSSSECSLLLQLWSERHHKAPCEAGWSGSSSSLKCQSFTNLAKVTLQANRETLQSIQTRSLVLIRGRHSSTKASSYERHLACHRLDIANGSVSSGAIGSLEIIQIFLNTEEPQALGPA